MLKVIGLLLIGVLLSFIGIMVALIIMNDLRGRVKKWRKLSRLGFKGIEHPDQGLINRIIELHRKTDKQLLEVESIFVRQGPGYQIYLFDVRDIAGEGAAFVNNRLALTAPGLHLPRFSLYPKIAHDGRGASLANRAINNPEGRKGGTVSFAANPEFENQYLVIGESVDEVRAFFTDERLRRLSETKYWMIEAGGDMFTFDRFEIDEDRRMAGVNGALEEGCIEDALIALEIFTGPVVIADPKEIASIDTNQNSVKTSGIRSKSGRRPEDGGE